MFASTLCSPLLPIFLIVSILLPTLTYSYQSPQFTLGFILCIVHFRSFDKCIICICQYSIIQNSFSALNKSPVVYLFIPPLFFSPSLPLPAAKPLATTGLPAIFIVLLFQNVKWLELYNMQPFSWLLSLSNMLSKFLTSFCYRTLTMLFWNSCGVQLPAAKKCDSQCKSLVKKERGCLFKGCTDLE